MNNTAWKYLNAHQRDNLFMVIRGDRAQPQLLTMKRSSLDNGATVLDLLGGDKAIGLDAAPSRIGRCRISSI